MSTTTNKSMTTDTSRLDMADENKGNIFLKLVFDTLTFRLYYETCIIDEEGDYTETPLDNALHGALVGQFRSLFLDLSIDLSCLGYEVIEEFYTDQVLSDDGYELRLSGDYEEDSLEVEKLRIVFEEKAGAFLAELPDLIANLEPQH